MLLLLIRLSLALSLVSSARSAAIYSPGFVGCFENSPASSFGFSVFSALVDAAQLTPNSCMGSCRAMGLLFSAIKYQGSMCFCASSMPTSVKNASSPLCQGATCPGNSSLFCGDNSGRYMLVYRANETSAVQSISASFVNVSSSLRLYQSLPIKLTVAGFSKYLYRIDRRTAVSSSQLLTSGVASSLFNSSLTHTAAANSLELIASPGSIDHQNASRVAITVPGAVKDLGDSTISLNCPANVTTSAYLRCDLLITGGGNQLILTVNYGDGTEQAYSLIDPERIEYDVPVPQTILAGLVYSKASLSTASTYLLANSYFEYEGRVESLEIYATGAGSVNLFVIAYQPCASTASFSRMQLYSDCSSQTARLYELDCATFSAHRDQCAASSSPGNGLGSLNGTIAFSVLSTLSLTLKAGYNLIPLGAGLSVSPGSFLAFNPGSASVNIAIDSSSSPIQQDYEIADAPSPGRWPANLLNGKVSALNSSTLSRFLVKPVLVKSHQASLFGKYNQSALANVSVSLSNPLGQRLNASTGVLVYDFISNLTVSSPAACYVNDPCLLSASVASGTGITYAWTINGVRLDSSTGSQVSYAFPAKANYSVSVSASNVVSNATAQMQLELTASQLLSGVSLRAGAASESASVVGRPTEFLFTLTSGNIYTCSIDYGDGSSPDQIVDTLGSSLNNTFIVHSFPATVGVYSVSVECRGESNNASLSFRHFVQLEAAGVNLTSPGIGLTSAPYRLTFSVANGSDLAVTLVYQGSPDSGVQFDAASMTGHSSWFSDANSVGLHSVSIVAENFVSRALFVGFFEVSSPIVAPTLNVSGSFEFETAAVVCELDMASGSTVKIELWLDASRITSSPDFELQLNGTWPGLVTTPAFDYSDPGDYTITARLSNVFGAVWLSRNISIVSLLNDLRVAYSPAPLYLFSSAPSRAEFRVFSANERKHGSHASVTFWPGDSLNRTKGPYALGMDFDENVNKVPISHEYSDAGNYTAVFELSNPLETVRLSLVVSVITGGIEGFHVELDPGVVQPGVSSTLRAYVAQGQEVKFDWNLDEGVQFTTTASTCSVRLLLASSFINQSQTIATDASQVRNYSLSVRAYNSASSLIRSLSLVVEAPVSAFSVSTSPADLTQLTVDTRSVTLNVSLADSPTPTNAYFLVDYGDGTSVDPPGYFSTPHVQLAHTFSSSGSFTVNITVFNHISVVSKLLQVVISKDFGALKCVPHWRPVDSDGTADYPDVYSANQSAYMVPREYDARFKCSWANSKVPSHSISVQLAGFSNTTTLNSTSRQHCTITVPSGVLASVQTANVSLTVSNAFYSRSAVVPVATFSAVKDLASASDTCVTKPGDNCSFALRFGSLGEPSCAQLALTNNRNAGDLDLLSIGSDQATCALLFPATKFTGLYVTNQNVWSFSLQLNRTGFNTINVQVANAFSAQSASLHASVSSLSCSNPRLSIVRGSSLFYRPVVKKRVLLLSVSSETALDCSSSLANQKQWRIYTVNSSTGAVVQDVTSRYLRANPSANYAELVLLGNTLKYGLYKFVYQVNMSADDAYQAQAETFVRIAQTGLLIRALESGVNEVVRAVDQGIKLDPVAYSVDFDMAVSLGALKFKFYCSVEDEDAFDSLVDLRTLKAAKNASSSCFNSPDDFYFTSNGNVLNILPGKLAYSSTNRIYRFKVATSHNDQIYYQIVKVSVRNYNQLPVVKLQCKYFNCLPTSEYVIINPEQLVLSAACTSGCDAATSNVSYKYSLFKAWQSNSDENMWIPVYFESDPSLGSGAETNELTLTSLLFASDSATRWKVTVQVTSESFSNGIAIGQSSLVFHVNSPPQNGSCSVSPLSGYTMSTVFSINCSNWFDPDGSVSSYEYQGYYLNGESMSFGFDDAGFYQTSLPVGAAYDNYSIYLFVAVTDNLGRTAYFAIDTPVQVLANVSYAAAVEASLVEQATGNDSSINKVLFAGDLKSACRAMSAISSSLNLNSLAEKSGLAAEPEAPKFLTTFGPQSGVAYSYTFDDYYSINAGAPGVAKASVNKSGYESSRNRRALARTILSNFVSNMAVYDIKTLKLQASMLATLTSDSQEITRMTADLILSQCSRLTFILSLSLTSSSELVQSARYLLSTIGNVMQGLSNYLNGRDGFLDYDFESANALPTYYDTDVENFWTNPYNFFGDFGNETSQRQMEVNKNIQMSKFQIVDAQQKAKTLIRTLRKLMAAQIPVGNETSIQTPSMYMSLKRVRASDLVSVQMTGLGKFQLPSFCDMFAGNSSNCSNNYITVEKIFRAAGSTGYNGNNETKIGFSNTVSLAFYDSNHVEIPVSSSAIPIDIWIPRDVGLNLTKSIQYQRINATNYSFAYSNQLLTFGFYKFPLDSSAHVQLKPADPTLGYWLVYKLGSAPFFNSTYQDLTGFKLLCPSDLVTKQNGDRVHVYPLTNRTVTQFQGYLGFGVKEMTARELADHCEPRLDQLPETNSSSQATNFTADFWLNTFLSGCYYLDVTTGKWRSDGLAVADDTDEAFTHCRSSHLTEFAGGWVIVAPETDFQYAFAHGSFAANPLIYLTVIGVLGLFALMAVWARLMDRADLAKMGVAPLPDNQPGDSYFYELTVVTGWRPEAGTDSRVRLVLSGESEESGVRLLEDTRRRVFRRGGIDMFIMTVPRPLGFLNYARVWHDNSGRGAAASWYLKSIVVHDLQTREKFHFACDDWLAVEKSDGQIERLLPVSFEERLDRDMAHLIHRRARQQLIDDHLWLSVFLRPIRSRFDRLSRVTCCFVILFITMLLDILYYEHAENDVSGGPGITLGPFYFSKQQVVVGFFIALIKLAPTLLVVGLFKRSRRRVAAYAKFHEALRQNVAQTCDVDEAALKDAANWKRQRKFSSIHDEDLQTGLTLRALAHMRLPWWTKIVAFVLSLGIVLASAFLIVVKGIEYGEEKVAKWAASLLVSFLSEILLIEPLKVVLISVLCVLVTRKAEEDDGDDLDLGRAPRYLEHDEEWLHLYRDNSLLVSRNSIFNQSSSSFHSQLNQYEIEEARRNRLREVKFWSMLTEFGVYALFLSVLYFTAYASRSASTFDYQHHLRALLLGPSFDAIERPRDFWSWSQTKLAPGLRASRWYNGSQPYGLAGFVADYSSRMIGYAVMRQVRVTNSSCALPSAVAQVGFCLSDEVASEHEETGNYSLRWTDDFDAAYSPSSAARGVYEAFQYRSEAQLESCSHLGAYKSYPGGGYIFPMRGQLNHLVANLTSLQRLNWIDRQTRAVLVELTLYNPYVNLVSVGTVLVEFLAAGDVVKSASFESIALFSSHQSVNAVSTGANLAYVVLMIYYAIRELRKAFRLRLAYLRRCWAWLDWCIIAASAGMLVAYYYRVQVAGTVLEFFRRTRGYGYINLQGLAFWNRLLEGLIGLCAGLGTLRFIRLLRFSTRIRMLVLAVRKCARELVAFSFIFACGLAAFVQLFYLSYYGRARGFASMLSSVETCFQMLVGKFSHGHAEPELSTVDGGLLGVLMFASFSVFTVFVLLNVLVSILSDTFVQVSRAAAQQSNANDMADYMSKKLVSLFRWRRSQGPTGARQQRAAGDNGAKYLDHLANFPSKIDQLLFAISEIYSEQRSFNDKCDREIALYTGVHARPIRTPELVLPRAVFGDGDLRRRRSRIQTPDS